MSEKYVGLPIPVSPIFLSLLSKYAQTFTYRYLPSFHREIIFSLIGTVPPTLIDV